MDVKERRARWRTMDAAVQGSTAEIWAKGFLERLET
jgi:trehalose-6-phosphate synthase